MDAGLRDEGVAVGPGLWTYVHTARRRPFVHPIRTPAGRIVTVDAPADHPWHHGLWFAIKFVNGENFWEEVDRYGVLRHTDDPPVDVVTFGDRIRVSGTLDWVRPDRRTVVLRERRSLTHVPVGDDAYAIDFVTELVPEVDVVLDRTPFTTWGGYGGLAFRGAAELVGSRILLDHGPGRDHVHGDRSRWLALSGILDGSPVSVALLDHRDNVGHPTPWYGRAHLDPAANPAGGSNFVNAAFLWDGPREVQAGRPLTLRYRVMVHDGDLGRADVAVAHESWLVEADSAPTVDAG